MTKHAIRTHILGPVIALVVFATVPLALAQATHEHGAQATPPAASAPAAQQQAMMMKMMDDMQAQQKRLSEMVAKMNAATGQAKVDQIAAVVTEMAAMHGRMTSMMTMMHGGGGMMQHGAAETPGDHTEPR